MPYPASPPAPPPLITTPTEETSHSNTALVVADPGPAQSAPPETQVCPGLPKALLAESPAPLATADFVKQAGESRASLLGAATAGYLLDRDAQLQLPSPLPPSNRLKSFSPKADPSRLEQNQVNDRPLPPKRIGAAASLQAVPSPKAAIATTEPSRSPATTVYAISGTTAKSPGTPESAVMAGLGEAIVVDEFAEDQLAEAYNHPGPPGLEIVAQTSEQGQTPVVLPITPFDQSPASNPLPPTTAPSPQSAPPSGTTPPVPAAPPSGSPPTTLPPGVSGIVELNADRQTYDEQHRTFTAEGNVLMRFQGALLDADRLQVNLDNRVAVAEGNVALTRGSQVLRGSRMEYNLVQGTGTVLNASGEIYIPTTGTDLSIPARGDNEGITIPRPVSDRVLEAQPQQNVQSPGSFSFGFGVGRDASRVPGGFPQGGQIRRLRFEAERVDFTPEGWVARNIQITNDPFSPPELVLKADEAKLTRLSPLRDEVRASRPRLVFDQRVTIPILVSRLVLDRRKRSPALVQFGYDDTDRGGLFAERSFEILSSDAFRLTLTPQFYIQRTISNGDPLNPDNFGFRVGLESALGPLTSIRGKASFTSLDFSKLDTKLRASLRAQQVVGNHIVALEYTFRDRLFNGSLGFQTVQSSLGALVLSPKIQLGKTGIELTYQAGFQYINADTDRLDLLPAVRTNNRIDLGRFQATARLYRATTIWQGKALPATATEGLRYTPIPITPYVNFTVDLRGVTNLYTSGDSQSNFIVGVGMNAQFGHFARNFLDYTAFSINYYQFIGNGKSPFLFDRAVDNRILTIGVTQQLYGPFRIGFQTAINLDSSNQFSTDYILEYSRRTYAIILRYNPVLSIGTIGLRISDFNWTGGADTFEGSDVTPVEGGVILRRDE